MKAKTIFIGIVLALGAGEAIGQTLWSGNGHYYQVVAISGVDWATANTLANASTFLGMDGHLATITSASENAFITSLLPSLGYEYWLGGYQVPPNQLIPTAGWTWVNGEGTFPGVNGALGYDNPYSNWSPGEPNDYYGAASEQFLSMWAASSPFAAGLWNDAGPVTQAPYITGYIVEYQTATVPEGGLTIAMFGTALTGLVCIRRKV